MNYVFALLPFASFVISFIFAFFVFKRYWVRRGPHLLLGGIGMVFYGIGGFCEAYYAAFGWNDLVFRPRYLFAADAGGRLAWSRHGLSGVQTEMGQWPDDRARRQVPSTAHFRSSAPSSIRRR